MLRISGLEVLASVGKKSSVFSRIMLCSPLIENQRFGGTCGLNFQGREYAEHETNMKESACQLLLRWFLA
jgi:hypothetical protein